MNKKLVALALASLPSLAQISPVLAQQQQTAQQQQAAVSPDTPVNLPGLYYDPNPAPSPTFQQLPGAEEAGYVEVPPLPNGVTLPYQVDRAWPQGATPDQVLKFGDLEQNPVTAGFTKLTLRDITAQQGTDIAGVPVGDVPLVGGLTVQEVDDLYTKIGNGEKIKVKDATPAIQAALGILEDPSQAGKQLQQAAFVTGEKVLITKLSKIPALKGVPLQDLAKGNWEGVISKAEQIELAGIGKKIGPTLKKLPVNQIVPIVGDAINGNWEQVRQRAQAYIFEKGTDIAVKEVIKAVPELKDLPLGAVPDLVNQPIEKSLPKIADLAIKEIPGAEDKLINTVPGLSKIPINKLPFDLAFSFLAGDIFARFDIAYSGVEGKEEPSVDHALSGGSEDQKFKPIKCTIGKSKQQRADNCPHFEMRKFVSSPLAKVTGDDDVEGKQWVQGDSGGKNGQGVKGGKGFLKVVNGGWEPAGIHPFSTSSHTKFLLKKITEYPDKPSTAKLNLAFQFCFNLLLLGEQCTPHFLVIPTPFIITEGGLFLVASRRNLPASIARLRNQTLSAGVYCDPNQLVATAGQSDTGTADTKYGHQKFEETDEELFAVTSVDGEQQALNKDAAESFEQMRADAAAQGLDIKAVSGFRDKKRQEKLFADQVAKQGSPEAAAKISAPPGHSEHHTGLAVDVGNNQNATLEESWADTPEYAWMQANAGKYGYELSFPKDNSQGVTFEPWHWRYVGSEQAQQAFSSTADDGQNNGTPAPSTPADPEHNVQQYLARIAFGESSGGINTGSNPETGARGEYQFIPATRQAILNQHGVDAWSPNKAERDQAVLALIRAFGNQGNVNEDIIGLIKTGDFARADQLLGQHSGSRSGQFTSLPGGAEQHQVWNDPAVLEQYGPTGDASTNAPTSVASSGLPCNPGTVAGVPGVLTPEGDGVATGSLSNPLSGYPTTSEYGYRTHPVTGAQGSFHAGIDIGAPTGTPVKAADGGTVDYAGFHPGGHGNLVVIYHGDGLATWYAHNSAINVRVGQNVTTGDKLAEVGSTGTSTGPHLDFGVRTGYIPGQPYSGQHHNPRNFVNF